MNSEGSRSYPEPAILSLSCVYANDDYWAKYLEALRLGWTQIDLLRQLAAPFCGAYRDYYRQCAEIDAIARGYGSDHNNADGEYFLDCAYWNDLRAFERIKLPWPSYSDELATPLANFPRPVISKHTRRSFSRYKSSLLNSAILNIACRVEGLSFSHLMSKVLVWHFDKYWSSSYSRQLIAADTLSWNDPAEGEIYVPKQF